MAPRDNPAEHRALAQTAMDRRAAAAALIKQHFTRTAESCRRRRRRRARSYRDDVGSSTGSHPSSMARYCGCFAAKAGMNGHLATRAPRSRSISKTPCAGRVPIHRPDSACGTAVWVRTTRPLSRDSRRGPSDRRRPARNEDSALLSITSPIAPDTVTLPELFCKGVFSAAKDRPGPGAPCL